jgi:hypothetical protein
MHVAGNASYRNAPGIVTIILHGAGVTVKRNIPAARCAARKAPQSMGAATGLIWAALSVMRTPRGQHWCRLRAPTHSQN